MRRAALGAALLLAACSGQDGSASRQAAAPAPKAAPVPAAPAAAPVPPAGADAVEAALAAAKAFNARAVEDLAAVDRGQKRIHAAAMRAMEAARQGQANRVTAARTEAEGARAGLTAQLDAFRTDSAVQTAAVDAAVAQCAATPELAAYAGCAALAVEQALLAKTIAARTARYEAAEAAYRQDRTRLEEAAATVALGGIG